MRQAYRIIPIYTADVSGVCSALYELGGMTVMHDPSGCNSTYNTHDEIRWYDQDSLIFISALTEMDAIMGNDDKLIQDTKAAAKELHPQFIALASSPIPYMNGTDFPAIAEILEQETGIPAFSVATNGMHDYVSGAGQALEAIAERFVQAPAKAASKNTVNLLGVTPLDFGPLDHAESMKRSLEEFGWTVNSMWAMGDTLEALSRSARAAVNIVVSSVGLRSARLLHRKFNMPYVVGAPVGLFAEELSKAAAEAVRTGICRAAYLPDQRVAENKEVSGETITLIGEPVTMGSLAAAIRLQYGVQTRVLCPLEETGGLLGPGDEAVFGEELLEEKLKTAEIIIADPLYRPICPKECQFFPLPHIAFSGRIYLKQLKQMPGFADLMKIE